MITRRGDFGFNKMLKKSNYEKNKLPRYIGITAKNWYLLGFRKGGGQTDAGAWEKRKSKKDDKGRALLVKSGKLRDSISVISGSWDKIVIGSRGIVYAAIHNFGLQGKAFGKYSFKMPQREFLGESQQLNTKIQRIIKNRFNMIFK